jgi:hypothetical protein
MTENGDTLENSIAERGNGIKKKPLTSVNSLTDLYVILTGLILENYSTGLLGSSSSSPTNLYGL